MTTGVSNELGAANALIQALELDPTLRAAAEALAGAPEPREGTDAMAPRVAMLRRVRGCCRQRRAPGLHSSSATPGRWIPPSRSSVAHWQPAASTAASCCCRWRGTSTAPIVPSEGRAALLLGSAITTDAARRAYRAELSWVASPAELARWDSLAPRARPAWLAGFWSSRDVAEGRPDGDRLDRALPSRRVRDGAFPDQRSGRPIGRRCSRSFTRTTMSRRNRRSISRHGTGTSARKRLDSPPTRNSFGADCPGALFPAAAGPPRRSRHGLDSSRTAGKKSPEQRRGGGRDLAL